MEPETNTQTTSQSSKNMTPVIVGIILLLGLGFFGYKMMSNKTTQQPAAMKEATMAPTNPAMKEEGTMTATSPAMQANVKEFTITGSNFKYDLSEMKVKKGDTVKVTFKNSDGFHDWNLDEFKAHTKKIPAGQSETVQFVADKTGTFEFYCSVGDHRAMGMKGNFIVE